MKSLKLTILILIIFLKTGNVLSEKNLFNVNNIEIINGSRVNNEALANKAIKKGFYELIDRILLTEDAERLKKLSFSEIKDLVSYYQIKAENNKVEKPKTFFNVFFDKVKIHNLFFKKDISYSDIVNDVQKVVTSTWSGNTNNLTTSFTSSTQALFSTSTSSGAHFIEVFDKNPQSDTTAEVQYAVAFGHNSGSGWYTGNSFPRCHQIHNSEKVKRYWSHKVKW